MRKQTDAVLIDWVDAAANNGWVTEPELETTTIPCTCQSLGFLVKETDESITLALSRTTTKGHAPYADLITIPKVAIKRTKHIPV
jgi:hypothetical protein